jgi:hypothetical protein
MDAMNDAAALSSGSLSLTTVLVMAAVAAVVGVFFGYTVVKHYLRARG